MTFNSKGEEIPRDNGELVSNILNSRIGGLDNHDADLIMKELYEIHYGINYESSLSMKRGDDGFFKINKHQRQVKKRPFSAVAFFPGEDNIHNSRLERLIRRYGEYKINHHFNISILEYMELTPAIMNLFNEIAMEKNVKIDADNETRAKELIAMQNGLKGLSDLK